MLRTLLGLFSSYAHPFERKADRFFKSIKSNTSRGSTQKKLSKLMQENLVVLNLWMEKKYKNYAYLKKGVRKRMYADVEVLKIEFLKYYEANPVSEKRLHQHLTAVGNSIPARLREQLIYLATIMEYLKPGPHYTYQAAANFGKLLKNPLKEKLVGDCNQIVTLYTFLYALKYPISDLRIKILPRHVCLHIEGIDIEATNATFKKYKEFDYILPITEIVSTNLLDVVDVEAKTKAIHPRAIVKRAQLAEKISSMRDLVTRNLEIAYKNLGIMLMKDKDYKGAIFFFEKTRDRTAIQSAYRNAAVHYMNKKSF
ncbi:MAG: hypothetical protein Q8P27_02885, partial [Candidatus Peregrinibacteria bacterium]|nr:hypothetical protein [Candidatus Peregrinibacteria bacterium]